jgi:putative ABC transport system substrate-binding protein
MAILGLSLILVLGMAGQPQAAGNPRRIGMLTGTKLTIGRLRRETAFRRALLERGYIEGHDITIVHRRADGDISQLGLLAQQLVRNDGVEVIVASSTEAVQAAKDAVAAAKAETSTMLIPIVMTNVGDPMKRDFVRSLARPGRNITGLSNASDLLVGKLLELLIEAVPQLRKIAVIHNGPLQPAHAFQLTVLQGVADARGIDRHEELLDRADGFDSAFQNVVNAHPQALIVLSSALHFAHARRIAELALAHRLPASAWSRTYAANGLLMTYGANEEMIFERAADYVERLLFKGADPADTPVEQPTAFELVINQRTAQQLDLILPPALYRRETEVIR